MSETESIFEQQQKLRTEIWKYEVSDFDPYFGCIQIMMYGAANLGLWAFLGPEWAAIFSAEEAVRHIKKVRDYRHKKKLLQEIK